MSRASSNWLCLLLFITTSSCASIFSGTTQTINVQAVDAHTHHPIRSISCNLTDATGINYTLLHNPGKIEVARGHGALTPNCYKEGYLQRSFATSQGYNPVTLFDVLLWPSVFVDAKTGAMHKYPADITILMEKRADF